MSSGISRGPASLASGDVEGTLTGLGLLDRFLKLAIAISPARVAEICAFVNKTAMDDRTLAAQESWIGYCVGA